MNSHQPKHTALLALLLIAPAPSIGVAVALFGAPGLFGSAVWAFAKLWFLLAPVLWYVLIEKQRISWSPLQGHVSAANSGMLAGLLSGLLMAASIVGGYLLFGKGQFDPAPMRSLLQTAGLTSPERYLLMAAYWTLFNSLVEEYAFRWFLFRQCERLLPAVWAVLAAAVIFTVHHSLALSAYVPWQLNLLGSLGVGVAGVIWSALYARYRSVWPGYLSHLFADVAVFAVGYDVLFG
ncbi:CPBP family intramembrane metalloprotease [Permianibacter sp. IMCC34836]|uniref:CPBP family intramembrane glutamic endopeptidase n=1 Tax=Permianibacter fluminis TaxID=2738515 RepID=UPI00155486C7|nr:CPBP family intramembrane glutamic endopeptidase [Permianibacter fluminis]NQD38180.1 CPBP family intramembrane metalloprotease [Permianibacter fluminis]